MWYGTQFPGAPQVWETQASFAQMWNGSQRIFFWTDQDDPPALRGLTSCVIARRGGKTVFSNQVSTSGSKVGGQMAEVQP
jgi:hypothetical protein